MMKKIFTVILSLTLLLAMSQAAFAANPITEKAGSDSADVKGTYAEGASAQTIYSVEIVWGDMGFTYTDESEGTWNASTHEYQNKVPAAWSCDKTDGNKITVTNHSNAAIKVNFTYAPEALYSGITGTFSSNSLDLKTAVGTKYSEAPSGSVTLDLNGALSKGTSNAKIGTVTVTLADE